MSFYNNEQIRGSIAGRMPMQNFLDGKTLCQPYVIENSEKEEEQVV